jgi:hypothetical protein
MHPVILFSLLVTSLLLPGCMTSYTKNKRPPPVTAWVIRIETSGGIAGGGAGGVVVSSDRTIVATKPGPQGKAKPCEGKLSEQELKELSDSVEQSTPDEWKISGPNAAAPDAFSYTLELQTESEEGKQVHRIGWFDNTRELVPADVKRLYEAANQAKIAALKKCAS